VRAVTQTPKEIEAKIADDVEPAEAMGTETRCGYRHDQGRR
jgi:hypothetical protein